MRQTKKLKKKEKYTINLSLFQDIFEDDIEISELVDEYNNNIYDDNLKLSVKNVRRKWIVEFPYEIILNYMKIQVDNICKIINNIITKEEIKTIIFVGGYCSNEILIKLIKNGLKEITTYLQPSNPSLAIMDGAVLFGIEPSTINVRKAKYTIGEMVNEVWNEKIHSKKGKKYLNEEIQKYFCRDCFRKYIEINQSVNYEEEFSNTCFAPTNGIKFQFYKTKKKNPIFIFEEGITKIGECELYIDKEFKNYEDREIKTTMKFGGTFIDVKAIHIKIGQSVETTLKFD